MTRFMLLSMALVVVLAEVAVATPIVANPGFELPANIYNSFESGTVESWTYGALRARFVQWAW